MTNKVTTTQRIGWAWLALALAVALPHAAWAAPNARIRTLNDIDADRKLHPVGSVVVPKGDTGEAAKRAQVVHMEGEAQWRHGEAWKPVKIGQILAPGTMVGLKAGARLVLLTDTNHDCDLLGACQFEFTGEPGDTISVVPRRFRVAWAIADAPEKRDGDVTDTPKGEPLPPITPPTPVVVLPPTDLSPEVEQWLDKLESRSSKITTFAARIRWDRVQGLLGDEQRRFGKVYYEAGPPARFAVHFDLRLVDGEARQQDRWYVFDGRWFVERNGDERRFIKKQIVAPDADPDETDPLGTGSGPFALPIRVKKAKLVRRFKVELIPFEGDDPANSIHLRLTPRPGVEIEYDRFDVWYDRDTLLPRQFISIDEKSEDEHRLVIVKLPTINEAIDEKLTTNVAEPTEPGWRVEVTPWKE